MVTLNPYRQPCPYDIGDTLITENATDPAKRWPGTTWRKEEGVFLLGASGKYPVGSTGGKETVTLTKDQMPAHTHQEWIYPSDVQAAGMQKVPQWSMYANGQEDTTTKYAYPSYTGDTGGGQAHTNMPPYKAKYIWTRTA